MPDIVNHPPHYTAGPVEPYERHWQDAADAGRVWLRWWWLPARFGVAMCAEAAHWLAGRRR